VVAKSSSTKRTIHTRISSASRLGVSIRRPIILIRALCDWRTGGDDEITDDLVGERGGVTRKIEVSAGQHLETESTFGVGAPSPELWGLDRVVGAAERRDRAWRRGVRRRRVGFGEF